MRVDGKVLHQKNHIVITDPKILVESANKLNIKKYKVNELENLTSKSLSGDNVINVYPVKLQVKNKPGVMNIKNARIC